MTECLRRQVPKGTATSCNDTTGDAEPQFTSTAEDLLQAPLATPEGLMNVFPPASPHPVVQLVLYTVLLQGRPVASARSVFVASPPARTDSVSCAAASSCTITTRRLLAVLHGGSSKRLAPSLLCDATAMVCMHADLAWRGHPPDYAHGADSAE